MLDAICYSFIYYMSFYCKQYKFLVALKEYKNLGTISRNALFTVHKVTPSAQEDIRSQ